MKAFKPEELAQGHGKEGAPTLVAVDGKVYDVSASKRWPSGKHMNRHEAGHDLTADIASAPHGKDVLERFELVGSLEEKPAPAHEGLRGQVEAFLNQFPFFRRHPHPAVVHFPLGLLLVAPLLLLASLIFGSPCTEWAAYCLLLISLAVFPAVIATGYFTWWINYEAAASPLINRKRAFAWVALALTVTATLIRTLAVGAPTQASSPATLIYVANMIALAGCVSWVGFLGGNLTFPYDSH